MDANNALIWLTGSLYGHTIENVYSILPLVYYYDSNRHCFKSSTRYLKPRDSIAIALGTRIKRIKMILLILSVMLAGSSISIVGGISFLGLIAPHIARKIVGYRHVHVVMMSGLIGAILILFSDGLARGIHPPLDIPVGVVIAIVGVPYFLLLLRRI